MRLTKKLKRKDISIRGGVGRKKGIRGMKKLCNNPYLASLKSVLQGSYKIVS